MLIGVFGGTFDPVHLGHLAVAQGACLHLGLDEVVFIPAGWPWMKEGVNVSYGQHRLRMVELAVEGVPMFRADDTEVRREGVTYTVDTLREMEEASLGRDEVFLIMGADAYESFELWKEPDAILRMSTLAVASRPGGGLANFERLDSLLPQGSERGVVVPAQQLDISSSDIRDRVQQRRSLSGYVPPAVEKYIYDHGLYA